MKRAILYLGMFFILIPFIKNYTDIITDNTTGILYSAAENMSVNGAHNPVGNWLLLLWQIFPWALGVLVIIELLRWAGGRKKPKEPQGNG